MRQSAVVGPIGELECGAIKACKDLPVSQSEGKWVCRGEEMEEGEDASRSRVSI